MTIRPIPLLVIITAILSLSMIANADGITKRIRFARGKHSATVSGAVLRGDRDTYILGAKGGQKITVRISSLEKNAVFQVEGPDGEYLPGAADGDDAMQLTATLPVDGDYRIIVGGTRGNASYRLTVSIR